MYTWSYKLSDKTLVLHQGEQVQVKFNYSDTCYFYDDCGNKLGWIPRSENPFDVLKDFDVLKHSGSTLTLVARKGTSTADNFMTDSYGSEFDLEKASKHFGEVRDPSGPKTCVLDIETSPMEKTKEQAVNLAAQYQHGTNTSRVSFTPNQPKKESMFTQILNTNKAAAEQAAVLETGRLANVTLKKIVAKRFP